MTSVDSLRHTRRLLRLSWSEHPWTLSRDSDDCQPLEADVLAGSELRLLPRRGRVSRMPRSPKQEVRCDAVGQVVGWDAGLLGAVPPEIVGGGLRDVRDMERAARSLSFLTGRIQGDLPSLRRKRLASHVLWCTRRRERRGRASGRRVSPQGARRANQVLDPTRLTTERGLHRWE